MEKIKRLTKGCEKNHGFSLSISPEIETDKKRKTYIYLTKITNPMNHDYYSCGWVIPNFKFYFSLYT